MPRKMRVEYAGAIYHVMSRGDRREDIFLDDVDRQDFLKTLAEACQKTGFQVHAYCLMRNHFHLVVETPIANLVAGMAWLFSARRRLAPGGGGKKALASHSGQNSTVIASFSEGN
jgi:REP element-mobilizing transposase RayT